MLGPVKNRLFAGFFMPHDSDLLVQRIDNQGSGPALRKAGTQGVFESLGQCSRDSLLWYPQAAFDKWECGAQILRVHAREPLVAIQVKMPVLINQATLDVKRCSRVCNNPIGHDPSDEWGCL